MEAAVILPSFLSADPGGKRAAHPGFPAFRKVRQPFARYAAPSAVKHGYVCIASLCHD